MNENYNTSGGNAYSGESLVYEDIGGYIVPSHLKELVIAGHIQPDEVYVIADLFTSPADYQSMLDNQQAFIEGRIGADDLDPRGKIASRRLSRLKQERKY